MSAHPESQLRIIRDGLRAGLTLSEVARRAAMPAAECDLALWAALGRPPPPPAALRVFHDPRRRQLGADRDVAPPQDDKHLAALGRAFPVLGR